MKCLVLGCENHDDQGIFIGDLCMPCHTAITTGQICPTTSYLGDKGQDDLSTMGSIIAYGGRCYHAGKSVSMEELELQHKQLIKCRKRIKELEDFVASIRDNYDCDSDAHKYGHRCRVCDATELLKGEE